MSVEMKEASDQELCHWYGAPIFHLQKHYPPPPPFFSSIHLCLQMFKAQYHLNHFLFHRWMLYQLLLSNIMQTIQQVRLPNQTALKFPSILNMSNILWSTKNWPTRSQTCPEDWPLMAYINYPLDSILHITCGMSLPVNYLYQLSSNKLTTLLTGIRQI